MEILDQYQKNHPEIEPQPQKNGDEEEVSKIIQWEMRYSFGLIRDKKQATYFTMGVIIVVIIISLYLFLK